MLSPFNYLNLVILILLSASFSHGYPFLWLEVITIAASDGGSQAPDAEELAADYDFVEEAEVLAFAEVMDADGGQAPAPAAAGPIPGLDAAAGAMQAAAMAMQTNNASVAPPPDLAAPVVTANIALISPALKKLYDEHMTGPEFSITDQMRARLVQNGIVDCDTFYDVASETPDDARQILAELAGLCVAGQHRRARDHVPASKLVKIFNRMHLLHETKDDGKNDDITASTMSKFATRFAAVMQFTIATYFLADNGTLGKLRKTFLSGRYEVLSLDSVKCQMLDKRLKDGAAQQQAQMQLQGLNNGTLTFGAPKIDLGYIRWKRALELMWYAILFIGNAVHTEKDEAGNDIPWMSWTTHMRIWAAFKQFVIEAPALLMIPFVQAETLEYEFRMVIFDYIRKYGGSFDNAMTKVGWIQLQTFFRYQNNNVAPPPKRAHDGDGNDKPPKKGKGGGGGNHNNNNGGGGRNNGGGQKQKGGGGKGGGRGSQRGSFPNRQKNGYAQCPGKPFWDTFQGKKFCVAYNTNKRCPTPNCDQWHFCSYVDCDRGNGKNCRACDHNIPQY